MPLGRIYVPPPLINSGSPSPSVSNQTNGYNDHRPKWDNNISQNNNGFRKIEIKVETKKDNTSERNKGTTFCYTYAYYQGFTDSRLSKAMGIKTCTQYVFH